MEGKTFWVKANLNQLNELASSLWLDSDRAAAFQGLCCGCTGVDCAPGAPDAFRRAWEIGSLWRVEAEAYRASRGAGGKASAEARRERTGTAQPFRTCVREMPEVS